MLDRVFNLDNPVWRFLSRMADLLILNLLFIVCSLPIITIGASITGVYYVCLKLREQEEGYVMKNFFKAFKENFKQSTLIWLIMLVFGIIIVFDFLILQASEGPLITVIRVIILIGAVLWIMVFFLVWPLQARFYNPVKYTLKNALMLSIAQAPRAIAMVGFMLAVLFLCTRNEYTFSYGMLYFIMLGFAVQAMVNVYLIYPVIKKMMPEEAAAETVSDYNFTVDEDVELTVLGHGAIRDDKKTSSEQGPDVPAQPMQ